MPSAGRPDDHPRPSGRWVVPVIILTVVAAIAIPVLLVSRFDDTSTGLEADGPRGVPANSTPALDDTRPPPTTSVDTKPNCCGEGEMGLFVVADREFDPWTREPSVEDQAFMRTRFDSMMVFSPYFDRRLDWYPDATVYVDAAAIYVNRPTDDRFENHPNWVLADETGEPLYIDFGCEVPAGCPQYIADVGNEAFRDDFVDRLADLVDIGYTSFLLDDVNLSWRISDKNGNARLPMDPRTGREMTLVAWQEDFVGLVERVRDEFPDLQIAHNSLWFTDSTDFDNDLVDRQIRAADVVFLERGATDRGLVEGESKFGFRTFLAFIDRVHALDRDVVLFDKSEGDVEDQIFNLASGLLINRGSDKVGTARDEFVAPATYWEIFDVDLGDAIGDRYDWNGLIRRDFSNGVVLVAEPDSATIAVPIEAGYTDLDGEPVDLIELDGGRAAILRSS